MINTKFPHFPFAVINLLVGISITLSQLKIPSHNVLDLKSLILIKNNQLDSKAGTSEHPKDRINAPHLERKL